MARKVNKKVLIPGIIAAVIVIGAVGFYKALFWGATMQKPKTSSITSIAEKLGQAPSKGGTIDLDSQDLNAIIQMLFKKSITKGGVTVKDIYANIPDDKLQILTPITYKGQDMLLTTTGKLTYKDNNIIYNDLSFKVGKIAIPKKYVMDKLKSLSRDDIKVTDDSIEISTKSLPIEIKSVKVQDKKIPITIKDTNIAKIDEKKNTTNTNKNTTGKSTTNNNTNVSERVRTLQRAVSQLNGAASACRTSGERAVIYAAQGELRKMISNPSYKPSGGAASSAYSKLSANERTDVKNAILSHVDTGSLFEIMNAIQ